MMVPVMVTVIKLAGSAGILPTNKRLLVEPDPPEEIVAVPFATLFQITFVRLAGIASAIFTAPASLGPLLLTLKV